MRESTRRVYLASLGAVITGATAGCGSADSDSLSPSTGTTTLNSESAQTETDSTRTIPSEYILTIPGGEVHAISSESVERYAAVNLLGGGVLSLEDGAAIELSDRGN